MLKQIAKEGLGKTLDVLGILDYRITRSLENSWSWLVPMYHRVITDVRSEDPFELGMCVTVKNFENQLSYIHKNFDVLTIREVVAALENGETLPDRIASITFDDGYRDNLTNALPILERFDTPATVFIATTILDGKSLWWDQMILLFSSVEQKNIAFTDGEKGHHFSVDSAGLADLLEYLWDLEHDQRLRLVDTLLDQYGIEDKTRELYLSRDDIQKIVRHPLIELGGHTITHQNLSKLDKSGALPEIQGCLAILNSVSEAPVETFAYPGGFYNNSTLEALRNSKINSAFTCSKGANRISGGLAQSQPKLLEIERIGMPNSSTSDFKRCFASILAN